MSFIISKGEDGLSVTYHHMFYTDCPPSSQFLVSDIADMVTLSAAYGFMAVELGAKSERAGFGFQISDGIAVVTFFGEHYNAPKKFTRDDADVALALAKTFNAMAVACAKAMVIVEVTISNEYAVA